MRSAKSAEKLPRSELQKWNRADRKKKFSGDLRSNLGNFNRVETRGVGVSVPQRSVFKEREPISKFILIHF
jgi:hypothetical protein